MQNPLATGGAPLFYSAKGIYSHGPRAHFSLPPSSNLAKVFWENPGIQAVAHNLGIGNI